MRMKRWSVASVVTVVAFLAASLWPHPVGAQAAPGEAPAEAPPADDTLTRAKAHFEAGKNAYNAGDYTTAIREFKAAELLRPSPILDYNIGLANEKLGKKRVAVKYYRRYLEQMPNATNRSTVEASIAQLEREIAAATGQPTPPSQPVEQPADLPPSQPPPPQQGYQGYDPYASQGTPVATQPPQPKKRNLWWLVFPILGGVALIVGLTAYGVLVSRSFSATSEPLGSVRTNLGFMPQGAGSAAVAAPAVSPALQLRF
jgi:hypothetical protein